MKNLNPEHFPELKSEVLQRLAGKWAEDKPSIQKITLYKCSRRDRSSTSKYAISATYDPDHSEAENYLAWTFGNESCGHVIDQLSDVYENEPPTNYEDNWIWFNDKPGEEDLNPFIVPEKKSVLYPPSITPISSEGGEQQKIFPCEPGTPWNKVIITRISNDAVMIETPKGPGRFHFSELKMSDKRSGDTPTKLWDLLMCFCEYTGRITSQTSTHGIQNLSKTRSDLNKRLKDIFGIHKNFCKKYNNNDGWVANCQFQDKIEST